MKSGFLFVVILSLGSPAFSQVAQKRQMQQAKPDTLLRAKMVDSSLYQKNVIKTSPVNHTPMENSVAPKNSSEVKMPAKSGNIASVGSSNMQLGNGVASVFDIFITVKTDAYGEGGFPISSGSNKDADTHWSCGVFDQNEKQIGSFHDDSDNDEYSPGSTNGPLKMHLDNAAIFNNFFHGGHVHINIAPNGNDQWGIAQFILTFDFTNPNYTKQVSWQNLSLSQDHRDIDLYFIYDGQNFVPRP